MVESTQPRGPSSDDTAITLPLLSLNAADFKNRVARLGRVIDADVGVQATVELDADAAEMIIRDPDRETLAQVRRLARDCGIATAPEELKAMALAWQAAVARDQAGDDHSDA